MVRSIRRVFFHRCLMINSVGCRNGDSSLREGKIFYSGRMRSIHHSIRINYPAI